MTHCRLRRAGRTLCLYVYMWSKKCVISANYQSKQSMLTQFLDRELEFKKLNSHLIQHRLLSKERRTGWCALYGAGRVGWGSGGGAKGPKVPRAKC